MKTTILSSPTYMAEGVCSQKVLHPVREAQHNECIGGFTPGQYSSNLLWSTFLQRVLYAQILPAL